MKVMVHIGTLPVPFGEYKMHSHSYWELLYYLEGHGEVTIEGRDTPIVFSPGTIVILPPNTPHRETSPDGFRTFFIGITQLSFSHQVHVFTDYDSKDILKLLELIMSAGTINSWNIYEWVDSIIDTIQIALQAQTKAINPNVQKAINIINANISNPNFSIRQIYSELLMSPEYLRRLFVAATSMNPTTYLVNKRIEYARALLSNSNQMSVKQVSNLCGFPDQLQFSKIFKKHTGVSPSKYSSQQNEYLNSLNQQ